MSEQRDTEIGVFDRVFNGAARARRELVAQMERNGSGQQVDSFIVAFSQYPMDSLPQWRAKNGKPLTSNAWLNNVDHNYG